MRLVHALAHPGRDGLLPTLVGLHGYGSHAQDLLALSPLLLEGQLLMLCLQAPHQIEPGFHGFGWCSRPGTEAALAETIAAADAVRECIAEATVRYPIDPARVALLGFSQGGTVAARVVLEHPARFVGLALLSSTLEERYAGPLAPAAGAERLSVLVQHGRGDATVPVAQGRAAVDRLRSLGLESRYAEYPMGHEVNAASAAALSSWLGEVLAVAGE